MQELLQKLCSLWAANCISDYALQPRDALANEPGSEADSVLTKQSVTMTMNNKLHILGSVSVENGIDGMRIRVIFIFDSKSQNRQSSV